MGYYFISVGGTGTRVLESLTHLCVAGLLPNKNREGHLYAMAIDPDEGNGNLSRTQSLLQCVDGFQQMKVGQQIPFLKTELKLAEPFVWSPVQRQVSLDQIIVYSNYQHQPIGKLYSALYTVDERLILLDEGFRGRPSIGAAVMAKKAQTDGNSVTQETAWQNLIQAINSDIRTNGSAQIFLAGSIFGGTGAAGLPTIAKILRDQFKTECAQGKVRIGGALLLPYFSFSPTAADKITSGIFASSDNFLTNTKAALRYYADTSGGAYDSMYFVGDETLAPMAKFSTGKFQQKNDAHLVDFFAAMAAVDFFNNKDNGQNCYYIARNDEDFFQWRDMPNVTAEGGEVISVRERFVQFTRFIFAYLHIIKPVWSDLALDTNSNEAYKFPWYKNYLQAIDHEESEVQKFEDYAVRFVKWLSQVESSTGKRSVKLIDPKSFRLGNGGAIIDPNKFSTLGYDNSKVTIDTIRTNLSRKPSNGGIFGRFFGPKQPDDTDAGFGKFIKLLYCSCR